MRPISLEIENLRSFRKKRILDFRDLGIFAIVGATGVGKTSILEAMTYALFNRTTYDGRGVRDLIAEGAASMSVRFTFSIEEDIFTVERIGRRGGNAQARLTCEARGINVQQVDNVTRAITQALCMDDEAFLHTVLLPQGLHARLLMSTQRDRNGILAELFSLSRLSVVESYARSLETRVSATLAESEAHRRRLGEDPAAALRRAEEELAACGARIDATKAAAKRVSALDELLREDASAMVAREQDERVLACVRDASQDLIRIGEARAELLPMRKDAADRSERQRQLKGEAALQLDTLREGGRDIDALERISRSLENARLALEALDRDQAQIARFREQIVSLHERTGLASAEAGLKRGELDDVRGEIETLDARIADLRMSEKALRNALSSSAKARQRADEDSIALSLAQVNAAEIGRTLAATQERLAAGQVEVELKRVVYESARVTNQAADIGAHVHPGDECPVCLRRLPKTYVAPSSAGMQVAKMAFEDAKKSQRALERGADEARQALVAANSKADQLAASAARSQEDASNAESAASALQGEDAADSQGGYAGIVASLDSADATRRDLAVEETKRQAALVAAERSEAAATASLLSAKEEHGRATAAANEHQSTLKLTIAEVPTAFRPAAASESVAESLARVAGFMERAREISDRLTAAADEHARSLEGLRALEARLTSEVKVPIARISESLLPVARLVTVRDRPEAETEVGAWCDEVCLEAGHRVKELEQEIGDLRKRMEYRQVERAAVVAELGAEPADLVRDLEIRMIQATGTRDQALTNVQLSEQNAERERSFRRIASGLGGLRTAMRAGEFPAYATRERQQRLLQEGTFILRSMTDGQFGFAEDFEIRDEFTQQQRSPATLSGGEKFLASLALSLAAVEVASSAGNKIDSIFLDEGFDSLDSDVLSRAMMQLRERATKGRMVCVISHVSQVTEFVNATIVVQKTADGTDFRRVDGPVEDEGAVAQGLVTHLSSL